MEPALVSFSRDLGTRASARAGTGDYDGIYSVFPLEGGILPSAARTNPDAKDIAHLPTIDSDDDEGNEAHDNETYQSGWSHVILLISFSPASLLAAPNFSSGAQGRSQLYQC